MFSSITNNYRSIIFYTLSALIATGILLIYIYPHGFHLSIPIDYQYDGMAAGTLVKTFIENGLSLKNPMLGAPGIYDFSDYAMSEDMTLYILRLFTLMSSHFAVVLNLFFILSFPLTVLSSLFVFQKLGLNKVYSFVAGLLFTFLPYHFLRIEIGHIFLITLYVIPIYVYLIFSVLKDPLFFNNKQFNFKIFFVYFLVCLFCASSNIYYAFFASYLLLFAGLIASLQKKRWLPMMNATIITLFIIFTVLLNILPAIISNMKYGPNTDLLQRSSFESEYYALKSSQLLLPIDQHRIKRFSDVKNNYNFTAPLVNNENKSVTLGIVGSIGFLLLILILLSGNSLFSSEILSDLSRLNMGAFLFGTIGGFSSLFAYLITPMIRGYDRISVFIAFFSLAGFFLVLQKLNLNKKICLILSLFILAIGLFDQIPHLSFSSKQASFLSDEKFIAAIEAKIPKGAMVMQLPFITFPESIKVNNIDSYGLFRGYLHSHSLHWSFGAMRGRGIAAWQEKVTKEPIREMINDLIYAGFSGIYLDRNGYTDHGQAIEKQIMEVLHKDPLLVNNENDLAFYDLTSYANTLHSSISPAIWQSRINDMHESINRLDDLRIIWSKGIYDSEQDKNTTWRWSQKKSKMEIFAKHDIKIKLSLLLKTGFSEYANIWISGDLWNETLQLNQTGKYLEKEIMIPQGHHYIYFRTNANRVNSGEDPRKLFFAIYNFSMIRLKPLSTVDKRIS